MKSGRFIQSVVISASLLAFAAHGHVRAQGTIRIRLFAPPPGAMRIESMWRILVINPGSALNDVYLTGAAFDLGLNTSQPVAWGTSARFNLRSGTYLITPADFSPIDADGIEPYKSAVKGVNGVPSGEYRICDTLHDAAGNVLAVECITQHVVLNLSPPRLLQPRDGAHDIAPHPTFLWSPAMPQNAAMRYGLKIVEMLGNQSAYDAMNSNSPWYEEAEIDATMLRYPFDALSFDSSTTYAWQVTVTTAIEGHDAALVRSEIWTFKPGTAGRVPRVTKDGQDDDNTTVRSDIAIGIADTNRIEFDSMRGAGWNTGDVTDAVSLVQSPSGANAMTAQPTIRDTLATLTEGYALAGSLHDASYVRAVGRLRFAYDNGGAARKLRMAIYDDRHAHLTPDRQPLDAARGRNRYEVDLTAQPGLADGAYYTLILDEGGPGAAHLRFRYVKPTTKGGGGGKTK